MYSDILKKKEEILCRIEAAKQKGGYTHDVTLVAVTKYHTIEETNDAIRAGIDQIGENHVQALLQKDPLLLDCKRNFIGHLQTNKVKQLLSIKNLNLIQSVDSLKLAAEIEKHAAQLDKVVNILVQVNIAHEESKFGISPEQTGPLLESIASMPHVHVKGLMSIMPIEKNLDYYRRMRAVFDEMKSLSIPGIEMDVLSMGMSNDFEEAVECGSTMVRIGSYLFAS